MEDTQNVLVAASGAAEEERVRAVTPLPLVTPFKLPASDSEVQKVLRGLQKAVKVAADPPPAVCAQLSCLATKRVNAAGCSRLRTHDRFRVSASASTTGVTEQKQVLGATRREV